MFVGGHFEHRYNGIAGWRTAAGCEDNRLTSRGGHGSDGGNIITSRVHDYGAALCRTRCLFKHLDDGTRAALADAAQTLFIQCGKATGLISRSRLAGAAVLSGSQQMTFIVFANFDDLVVNFRGSRPTGQHMFAADPFDGLAHDGRSAQIDQAVAQIADGRIGGYARGCVASAAFDSHEKFTHGEGLFLLLPRFGSHFPGGPDGFFDGF